MQRRPWLLALRLGLAALIVAYLVGSGMIQWSAVARVFEPRTVVTVVPLLVGTALLLAWRQVVLLRPAGFTLSFADSTRLTLIGVFFNTCVPGGADIAKIYYGSVGNRGRRAEITTVLLLDRVMGSVALLMWPVLAAPAFLPLIRASTTLALLVGGAALMVTGLIVGLVVLVHPAVNARPLVAIGRWRAGRYLIRAVEQLRFFRHRRGALLGALAIALLAHTLYIGAVLIVAAALFPGTFHWGLSVLIPLGFVANSLPITPSGLGVGEAAFEALFRMGGVPGGAEVMLGIRLLMLSLALAGLGLYLRGQERFVFAGESAPPAPMEEQHAGQLAGAAVPTGPPT